MLKRWKDRLTAAVAPASGVALPLPGRDTFGDDSDDASDDDEADTEPDDAFLPLRSAWLTF